MAEEVAHRRGDIVKFVRFHGAKYAWCLSKKYQLQCSTAKWLLSMVIKESKGHIPSQKAPKHGCTDTST